MVEPKKTLVLGASAKPSRYSYLAILQLRQHGHPVVAIGRRECQVLDVPVISHKASFEGIDTVTLYLNPVHQQEYYDYLISLRPSRIIFNPGTENAELEKLASANKISTMEACTLVLLSTGQY